MTPAFLAEATGCTQTRAELFSAHLTEACAEYEINTPARLAAFLAQIGHESGSLRFVEEIWGPTAQQRRYERNPAAPWPSSPDEARRPEFAGNRLAYTLGNEREGDGSRYRGHGLIQVTGRTNHRGARDRMRRRFPAAPDFEAAPDLLTEPRWAALSAADFWGSRSLNALADAGRFEDITRRINGGLNGQADRIARWERAKRALGITGTTEDHMPLPAFAKAALAILAPNVPTLGKLFGSGSEVAERNIKAAEVALQVVQAATGAANAQDAAERVARDPDAARAAEAAVRAAWAEISEAGGGGIEGAHKRSMEMMNSGQPMSHNPAFMVSAVLLLFPLMLMVDVFWVNPGSYSGELRVQIVTAILAVIAMVGGYWIGTSFSSAKKDEQRAR